MASSGAKQTDDRATPPPRPHLPQQPRKPGRGPVAPAGSNFLGLTGLKVKASPDTPRAFLIAREKRARPGKVLSPWCRGEAGRGKEEKQRSKKESGDAPLSRDPPAGRRRCRRRLCSSVRTRTGEGGASTDSTCQDGRGLAWLQALA